MLETVGEGAYGIVWKARNRGEYLIFKFFQIKTGYSDRKDRLKIGRNLFNLIKKLKREKMIYINYKLANF